MLLYYVPKMISLRLFGFLPHSWALAYFHISVAGDKKTNHKLILSNDEINALLL
jgi:hypothetical protein